MGLTVVILVVMLLLVVPFLFTISCFYMLAKKKVMFKDTFLEEETSSVAAYALVIPVGTYEVI